MSKIILDTQGRLITALVGHPRDSDWPTVATDASTALRNMRIEAELRGKRENKSWFHARGDFLTVPVGVSFGGGQKVYTHIFSLLLPHFNWCAQEPGNMRLFKGLAPLVRDILQNLAIQRIAGFQSSSC